MHRCASNDRDQQVVAKLAERGLEGNKTGKAAIECHMEGRHGLTKASLSVLEGMGSSVLQELGGLGGHALQHQVQAARVAGSQGEAQDDHLHLLHRLWACLHQQCCHTHTHTEAYTHVHVLAEI